MAPERFTFFWGHSAKARYPQFSQFFQRPFRCGGEAFNCAEQWMHWRKALLFQDAGTAAAILAEADPQKQKALGRGVAGFDDQVWRAVARDIVFRGNVAKFGQHPDLLAALGATQGTTIVEAAPNDSVWGIGLSASDPRALNRAEWQGTNWLGEVLTEVRDALLANGAGQASGTD